jgi:hypothetical protein
VELGDLLLEVLVDALRACETAVRGDSDDRNRDQKSAHASDRTADEANRGETEAELVQVLLGHADQLLAVSKTWMRKRSEGESMVMSTT